MLRIRILGRMTAALDDEPFTLSPSSNASRLWAYLLLQRGIPLSRKRVAFSLWPDVPEPDALAHLRRQIHLLQNLLPLPVDGCPWLIADRSTVQWNPECESWLDVEAFEAGCTAADGTAPGSADPNVISTVRRAIALYGGDLLSDSYDDWALDERERLRNLYGHALTRLLVLQAAEGDLRGAVISAKQLVSYDRLREEAHRLAIGFLYLAGDRAAALNAFKSCERVLAEELDVEPMDETLRLVEAMRSSASGEQIVSMIRRDLPTGTNLSALTPIKVPNNLPSHVTTFIDREREIASLECLLCTNRLLTLTGPAGCGKTRLALELAANVAARIELDLESCEEKGPEEECLAFPGGVWWVDLAPVEDPSGVALAVEAVLATQHDFGRSPTSSVEAYLKDKEALLLLDGCEHVVAACASLAERLLHSCPDLRVLVTSREPLGVHGEMHWLVPPMSTPPRDMENRAELVMAYDAPRLFLDRARLVVPGTSVTDENAAAVTLLCRRLDGIPLAIELAASQIQTLSADQIARRLDDRFALLSHGNRTGPPHHRTLEAAIDWSFDTLSEPERLVFRRLGVFHNGWSLEAAEAVCVGGGIEVAEILSLVTDLIDKSLVVVTDRRLGMARSFRLPETMRHYARIKLAGTDDADSVKDRHLTYYAAFAETAAPQLQGEDQAEWIGRLDRDRDNFRAALERSLTAVGDGEAGLRLAASLVWYWVIRGHLGEGREWLRKALLSYTEAGLTRQRGLQAAAVLADMQGDYEEAEALARENLGIATEAGDKTGIGVSLNLLGSLCVRAGRFAEAQGLYEECVDAMRSIGHDEGVDSGLHNLSMICAIRGDYAAARQLGEESLELSRSRSDVKSIAVSLHRLGEVAREEGDLRSAKAYLTDCLELCAQLDHRLLRAAALDELGSIATAEGDLEAAKVGIEESLALCRDLGDQEGIASSLARLGRLALAHHDLDVARAHQRESLVIRRTLGDTRYLPASLEALAKLDVLQDRAERSARLCGAAGASRESFGMPVPPVEREDVEHTVKAATSAIGGDRFAVAWQEGEGMTLEQGVECAMGWGIGELQRDGAGGVGERTNRA